MFTFLGEKKKQREEKVSFSKLFSTSTSIIYLPGLGLFTYFVLTDLGGWIKQLTPLRNRFIFNLEILKNGASRTFRYDYYVSTYTQLSTMR